MEGTTTLLGKRPAIREQEEQQQILEQQEQQLQIDTVNNKRQRVSLLQGCRSVENYEHLNLISEGTYGVVYRAKDRITNQVYAIKKVKFDHQERDGFPISAIRELTPLIELKHPNIVSIKEVVYGGSLKKIYVVMEYQEHELKTLLEHKKYQFTHAQIKTLIYQLLSGVECMHRDWIVHRDLKTSNLLYSNQGQLKICDFGLARKFGNSERQMTNCVVTLWYRSPELLLGEKWYTQAIDIWSVGCIFAELILREALLPGRQEMDQLDRIFRLFGNPNSTNWPQWTDLPLSKGIKLNKKLNQNRLREKFPRIAMNKDDHFYLSDCGLDLMQQMFIYDPAKRISASDALKHPWFREQPLPATLDEMPKFDPINEMARTEHRQKQKQQQAQ